MTGMCNYKLEKIKELQNILKARRIEEDSFLGTMREVGLADTKISDFQPPKLCNYKFLLF